MTFASSIKLREVQVSITCRSIFFFCAVLFALLLFPFALPNDQEHILASRKNIKYNDSQPSTQTHTAMQRALSRCRNRP
ncbi:hypothetical protein BU25DRAFT_74849 [Macroventuria anomochaeta]|uniref:Uncharacterized protein n=1 Tax=Macroventuria anomochaeta TaxID=301207 RepID=A0ACB6RYU8_9PLEO|nr:uncharacterized protein BU25DRAFT_74849 [Macroventuria anomochaeta]KAF2626893.1 hypothetical protein BU25DRAFT_74849 [Macroventuria anomochaeta]